MNKEQLFKRIDQAWEALKASYDGLSSSELLETGVTGTWSVKDIIAHVTWWEEEALTHLPLILEGRKPPKYSVTHGGIDAFNAQMYETKKNLSISAVLQEHYETHSRLIDFLAQVPLSQIESETRFRHRLRLDTYGHYPIHAKMIQEWRAHQRSSPELR